MICFEIARTICFGDYIKLQIGIAVCNKTFDKGDSLLLR
jgi:hypothetical protein